MRLLIFFISIATLVSCVSNRKAVLLQKSDLHESMPTDSVLRTYANYSSEYRIQPNDLLSIRFESLTQREFDFLAAPPANLNVNPMSAQLIGELVDETGCVPFPVIGKVHVAGLTLFEAQDTLQEIANRYLESPIVKIRLLNFRITILGEVVREGAVTLNNTKVSMIEAIGQAGGLGELADRSNIKVIRQVNGSTQVQYVNLLDENFLSSPFYYVHQNDVLIVPPLRQKPFRKYFGQNLSLVVSTLSLLLLALNLTR